MIHVIKKRQVRQAGLSLVELMIGVTLGLALMLVVSQTFLSNRKSFKVQAEMARLQEGGRLALDLVGRDARLAGFNGCGSTPGLIGHGVTKATPNGPVNVGAFTQVAAPVANTWLIYDAVVPVTGFVAVAPPPGLLASEVLANTDIIQFQYFEPLNSILTQAMTLQTDAIFASINPLRPIETGDVLLISNCRLGTVFRASAVGVSGTNYVITHDMSTNTSANIIRPFSTGQNRQDVEIAKLVNNIYFVACVNVSNAPTGSCASNESKRYLWRKTLIAGNLVSQDMVEGVENMRILYGVNTNAVVDSPTTSPSVTSYVASGLVSDWSQVRSLQVSFLLRTSENGIATKTQIYKFNGSSYTATDLRVRKSFSSTLTLRNKLLGNYQ